MSKAFVKESDSDDNEDEIDAPKIPVGVRNYITPSGLKKIQEELIYLKTKQRPEVTRVVTWAAENGDRSENADYTYGKKKLREIDRRIRFLSKRLDTVEVIDPLETGRRHPNTVFFGATVQIRDEEGALKEYSIVGIDEVDLEKCRISWISPLGSALLKAELGDFVEFKSPKGAREIEVVQITYKHLD